MKKPTIAIRAARQMGNESGRDVNALQVLARALRTAKCHATKARLAQQIQDLRASSGMK
jgi:hypothetical protein